MTAPTIAGRVTAVAEQVRQEARQLDPAKVAATLLMVVPFALGWLAAQTVRAVWVATSWMWTALVVGWRTAYGRADGGDTP